MMMAKRVFYDDDARERVLEGARALYEAVKVTYGPKGRNVVIAKGYGGPTVTHDGVTVAEAVELPEDDDKTLGYGVRNVHRRLQLAFGDKYGLMYKLTDTGGTEVDVCVPADREI